MGKIKSLKELTKEVSRLKKKGKKIAFTNGCFDLLHLGHLKILQRAKKYGDILVVGLNSDSSIKKIKGPKRPILTQKTRAKLLTNMVPVDYVVIFSESTPYTLIKKIKPDVLVKGEDWEKGEIIGSNLVKRVFRVKLYPGHSTTRLIERIKKNG